MDPGQQVATSTTSGASDVPSSMRTTYQQLDNELIHQKVACRRLKSERNRLRILHELGAHYSFYCAKYLSDVRLRISNYMTELVGREETLMVHFQLQDLGVSISHCNVKMHDGLRVGGGFLLTDHSIDATKSHECAIFYECSNTTQLRPSHRDGQDYLSLFEHMGPQYNSHEFNAARQSRQLNGTETHPPFEAIRKRIARLTPDFLPECVLDVVVRIGVACFDTLGNAQCCMGGIEIWNQVMELITPKKLVPAEEYLLGMPLVVRTGAKEANETPH